MERSRYAGDRHGWHHTRDVQDAYDDVVHDERAPYAGIGPAEASKGDEIWQIIANRDVIALNQDRLGIQAKRIWCSMEREQPDTTYITDNNRVDILAKPLADGSVALCFINLSTKCYEKEVSIRVEEIDRYIGPKMADRERFLRASVYQVVDLWTGRQEENATGRFSVNMLEPCDSVTLRITPV